MFVARDDGGAPVAGGGDADPSSVGPGEVALPTVVIHAVTLEPGSAGATLQGTTYSWAEGGDDGAAAN